MAVIKMTEDQRRQMIADAAYFRAERRGFNGGDSLVDWLEAEAEIDEQLRQTEKARLLARFEEGVTSATRTLSSLKRRASTLAAGARAEAKRDADRLGVLRDALRDKLEDLRDEGARAGESAVHQAESVWSELTDAIRRLGTPLSH